MNIHQERPEDEITDSPSRLTQAFAAFRFCAVCAVRFAVKRKNAKCRAQKCCSRRCGAIWRVRQYPQHHTMHAANKKRRDDLIELRRQQFAGLSKEQCYRLGKQDGYSVGYQRRVAERRA